MHVGIGDRGAEEIIGGDRELHFFTDGGKVFRAFDRHFEFRLLVFLNFEVATRFCVANAGGDVIATQRRFISDIQVAAECAARGKRQILLENFPVVRIFDNDVDGFFVEQLITIASPLPEDAFEIDFLRRSIDGTIGVDVTGQVLAGKNVILAAFAAEVERLDV